MRLWIHISVLCICNFVNNNTCGFFSWVWWWSGYFLIFRILSSFSGQYNVAIRILLWVSHEFRYYYAQLCPLLPCVARVLASIIRMIVEPWRRQRFLEVFKCENIWSSSSSFPLILLGHFYTTVTVSLSSVTWSNLSFTFPYLKLVAEFWHPIGTESLISLV